MNDARFTPQRTIWLRGLWMVVMGLAYQLAGTLLFFLAFVQFVLTLIHGTPNPRLRDLGRSLGRYQGQIANFVSFADEQLPFPFSDWPAGVAGTEESHLQQ
jgi:hypothetical protein